eukprot:jgi/Chlat1/1393/Chrsp12S00099
MDSSAQALLVWLKEQGAEVKGCSIKRTKAGWGVFADEDWSKGALMTLPLSMALVPETVLAQEDIGALLAHLLRDGLVDGPLLVMLFLAVERAKGAESRWAPYMSMLPTGFSTPLFYVEDTLQQLAGTTLHSATSIKLQQLQRVHKESFEKIYARLLLEVGIEQAPVSFDDFLWAYSVYWSRVLQFPDVLGTEDGDEDKMEKDTSFMEGIIVGIDICNHDPQAFARFEVEGAEAPISQQPFSVSLVPAKAGALEAGKEVCISYGHKSNEELLFLYGFVLENNTADSLMIHCLDHLQADTNGQLRAGLLTYLGLSPQWLLPSMPMSTNSDNDATADKQHALPLNCLAALRVLAMPVDELEGLTKVIQHVQEFKVQIENQQESVPEDSDPDSESNVPKSSRPSTLPPELMHEVTEKAAVIQNGYPELNRKAYDILVGLLQDKLTAMETGTGTYEEDMERMTKLRNPIPEPGPSDKGKAVAGSGDTQDTYNCVVYRASQKKITKTYLELVGRLAEEATAQVSGTQDSSA